jgi:hypothetical protein
MHKNATKCNKTQSKWCINKHGASKNIDKFETYHGHAELRRSNPPSWRHLWLRKTRGNGDEVRVFISEKWCGELLTEMVGIKARIKATVLGVHRTEVEDDDMA